MAEPDEGQVRGPTTARRERISVITTGHKADLGRDEHLELLRFLGAGTFGNVYDAWWTSVQNNEVVKRKTAAKVSRRWRYQKTTDTFDMFEQEYKINEKVMNSGFDIYVPDVYKFAIVGRHALIVSELMEGGSLLGLLRKHPQSDPSLIQTAAHDIAHSLYGMHKLGYAHRDIKVDNILLKRGIAGVHEDSPWAYICDLGLATPLSGIKPRGGPDGWEECGTPIWKAPECYIDGGVHGAPADIWAMGLSLMFYLHETVLDEHIKSRKCDAVMQRKLINLEYGWPNFDQDDVEGYPDMVDFFNKCLHPDPAKRITAEECLKHPWLKEVRLRRQMARWRETGRRLEPWIDQEHGPMEMNAAVNAPEPDMAPGPAVNPPAPSTDARGPSEYHSVRSKRSLSPFDENPYRNHQIQNNERTQPPDTQEPVSPSAQLLREHQESTRPRKRGLSREPDEEEPEGERSPKRHRTTSTNGVNNAAGPSRIPLKLTKLKRFERARAPSPEARRLIQQHRRTVSSGVNEAADRMDLDIQPQARRDEPEIQSPNALEPQGIKTAKKRTKKVVPAKVHQTRQAARKAAEAARVAALLYAPEAIVQEQLEVFDVPELEAPTPQVAPVRRSARLAKKAAEKAIKNNITGTTSGRVSKRRQKS